MEDFKNIIIIGGSGFIGSKLTKHLSINKDLNITVIYVGDLEKSDKIEGVNYQKVDLLKDIMAKADCAILMAQPDESMVVNFLELTKDSNIRKIIYTSTLLLYPDSIEKHNESSQLDPLTDYENKKVAEEKLLINFANNKTKICIVRLGNVYGDKKNRGIVNYLMTAIQNKETFKINGDGEHIRDYIFVDDVARALGELLSHRQDNDLQIYNVCTGIGHSINELVDKLSEVSGHKIDTINQDPIVEKISVIGDNAKIKKDLGFNVKFNFDQGLKEAYKNYSI